MVDYAEGRRENPPPELAWFWRSQRWGLPYSGGWMEQPAGLIGRMEYAGALYEAWRAWREVKAGERARWKREHPQFWRIISEAREVIDGEQQ